MGLFDRIFQPRKIRVNADTTFSTLTAYQPVFTSWNGMLYESELCRSSIDAIARHCSKLKVEFKGEAKPKLKTLVKHKPNEWMTWSQFLYRAATILYCTNTCFIVPVLDKNLDTVGFFPVLPDNAKLTELNGKVWIRYTFRNGQVGAIEFEKCAVLTRFQYQSDFFGDTNRALDDTMGLIHINNQGIKTAVKDSATYRFIAKLNNFAKPEDVAKERERFTRNNFSSEAKSGGILLFPNTYTDIKQIDSKPYTVDADQMKLIYGNVQNYFGVNEDILQNKAIGDSWSAFYEGAVEPFAIQFSETMTKAMFSERERAQGSGIIATSNRLQFMSNNDKLTISSTMLDRGVMSINEIRDIWNLAPVEDGDRRIIRGEYYDATNKLEVTDEE